MATETVTPEVVWAQRSSNSDPERNFVYLTINVPDAPEIKLDLQPTGLTFTGYSNTSKKTFHVQLEFYAEIDPDNSKVHHTSRNVEMKLRKKELNESYWPRLLKDSKKVHFLKTDFDKWVDEDEQDETADDDFANFGGMGGMPGMGGSDFGGLDFSKIGSGSGDGDDDDDSDDDMPPLEGEEEEAKEETSDKPRVAEDDKDAKEVVMSS